jgi:beta-lactamase class A
MTKLLFSTIIFSFVFWSCDSQKKEPAIVELNNQIIDILSQSEGDFAVAFKHLTSGDTLFINANQSFHAASTMKTPVMIELYKQAQSGKISLEDSLIVKDEFQSIADGSSFTMRMDDDSEDGLYAHMGSKVTIRELMYQMITKSSNLATNMLIELAGAGNVMLTLKEMGANDMQVLRGVEDIKAFDKGMNNTTTAFDLMLIYEALGQGAVVSKEASDEMVVVLLSQQFNEIIPANLPDEVKVAHKTGSITGVQHDSGLIITPNGDKYVLVLLSKNLEDTEEGINLMAQVSKEIYDYVQLNQSSAK